MGDDKAKVERKEPKRKLRPTRVILEPKVTKAQWAAVLSYIKFYNALDPELRLAAKHHKEIRELRNA